MNLKKIVNITDLLHNFIDEACRTIAMHLNKISKFITLGFFVGNIVFFYSAKAVESFTQDGKNYILKSGVVGFMHKPLNKFPIEEEGRGVPKRAPFFDVYDLQKSPTLKTPLKKSYRVVYREVIDPRTKEKKEIPALLTGQVLVKSKNPASGLNVSLKLRKSFQDNGFYLYELPSDQPISQVLENLSKQSGVEMAQVEIIEQLRVPL